MFIGEVKNMTNDHSIWRELVLFDLSVATMSSSSAPKYTAEPSRYLGFGAFNRFAILSQLRR